MSRPTGSKNISWSKEELQRLYWTERMSCHAIAKQYGTVYQAVLKAMQGFGIPRRTHSDATSGDLHYAWRGHYVSSSGYTLVFQPGHHRADKRGYVYEHIPAWEQHSGRPLHTGEVVHHLNGIKTDNRPINLLAMPKSTHDKLIPALRNRIRELEQELDRCRQMVLPLEAL